MTMVFFLSIAEFPVALKKKKKKHMQNKQITQYPPQLPQKKHR